MDGFANANALIHGVKQRVGQYSYRYVDPQQIRPYWDMAKQHVLADLTFQTQSSGSFTAHQDLVAGGTAINRWASVIDDPYPFPKTWEDERRLASDGDLSRSERRRAADSDVGRAEGTRFRPPRLAIYDGYARQEHPRLFRFHSAAAQVVPISAKLPDSYFVNEPVTNEPVDEE